MLNAIYFHGPDNSEMRSLLERKMSIAGWLSWLIAGLMTFIPDIAAAQKIIDASGTCYVFSDERRCTSIQPIWIGDGTPEEGSLTLSRLAHLVAPILWPSSREFLLLEDRQADLPGRVKVRDGGKTAYFHIREIRLRSPQQGAALQTNNPRIRRLDVPWSRMPDDLPIDQLDRVFIAFFFYYPEDRGVGGHLHDVEALEIQARFRRLCRTTPDPATLPDATCGPTDPVWDAAELESVSGSAHGVGWYTNTLKVSETRDTVLPIRVLVEENKHASSPDRDGDGVYMPHYDVNRQTNDAWGIRDVAGTGKLGGTSFRAEASRARRPETQICPTDPSTRLLEHYAVASQDICGSNDRYSIAFAGDDPICPQMDMLRKSDQKSDRHLYGLLKDKNFCEPIAWTTVKEPRGSLNRAGLAVAHFFSPGPDGEYGFQNAVQRLSFAYRRDGRDGLHGASAIFPIGHDMPFFGGWLIAKMNVMSTRPLEWLPPLTSTSFEGLYSPSASRPFDWYVTAGPESRRLRMRDKRRWHMAEEFGVRFRFSTERLRVLRFLGGRVGLRAESLSRPKNVRFVYEFGAGSW